MTTPMYDLDVPRLRKALEYVTANPREWDQDTYGELTACGTVACIAGHLVLADAQSTIRWLSVDLPKETTWLMCSVAVEGQPFEVDIDQRAADLLGVPLHVVANGERGNLFDAENTLADLWRIAGELSGGEIVAPPELVAS